MYLRRARNFPKCLKIFCKTTLSFLAHRQFPRGCRSWLTYQWTKARLAYIKSNLFWPREPEDEEADRASCAMLRASQSQNVLQPSLAVRLGRSSVSDSKRIQKNSDSDFRAGNAFEINSTEVTCDRCATSPAPKRRLQQFEFCNTIVKTWIPTRTLTLHNVSERILGRPTRNARLSTSFTFALSSSGSWVKKGA